MFENDFSNRDMAAQKAQREADGGDFLKKLTDRALALVARDSKPGSKVVSDDPELLRRTESVRGKKESMMEWFARTGVSAYQVRTLGKDELEKLVTVVMSNPDANYYAAEARMFEPQAPAKKFKVEVPSRYFLT